MPQDKDPNLGQGLSMGIEIAVGVFLGLQVGLWLERHYQWQPWASLIGSMLGLTAGIYLVLKQVNRK